ncbi:MAG: alpha/beta fold hydrolase [Pseudomonadota bacterium]
MSCRSSWIYLAKLALIFSAGPALAETEGYFGAQLGPTEADAGVDVVAILPGSPAAAAGLKVGDNVLSVSGKSPADAKSFAQVIRESGAGSRIDVEFSRGNQKKRLQIVLGTNPWQNANEPQSGPGLFAVTVHEGVPYVEDESPHEKHYLDLYVPETRQPSPALLWIHGGGWSFGNRGQDRALALRLAERGVVVASMSYRLSSGRWADPDAPEKGFQHPAHVNDVADAFRWLHDKGTDIGLDPEALFVGGHSAGGHLAALLATDERYLKARGLSLGDVAGAVPIGGTYDIPDYHAALTQGELEMGQAHIEAVFGETLEEWEDASPTRYLDRSTVPILVVVEEQAGFQRYARQIVQAARTAKRGNVKRFDATGRTHGNVILMMSGHHEDEVRAEILKFVKSTG